MAEDWEAAAADVSVGILEAGAHAVLLRPADGVMTDWGYVPGVDSEHPCKVSLMAITAQQRASSAVEGAEMVALIAPDIGVEPNTGDALSIGGRRWEILRVESTAPAGQVVLYKAQVARTQEAG